LLYQLLKFPARLAILLYTRRVRVSDRSVLKYDGPLLIACNHPNSFLDAIILSTIFDKPVYSLARGDVFNTGWKRFFLKELNMFPVYRTSEGVENLEHNYTTFDACHQVFKENGIVLIFSEGSCFNEWHLRPLKKGTARLALSSWEEGIPLKVLPAGINYNSFLSFGKNVEVNFGEIISQDDVPPQDNYGKSIYQFNALLQQGMRPLVMEFGKKDKTKIADHFRIPVSPAKKTLLALPAILGYLLHAPLYLPLRNFAWKKAGHNDHFDSVLTGVLFGTYPLYLLMIFLIGFFITHSWWMIGVFLFLPFCAWSFVQLKRQF